MSPKRRNIEHTLTALSDGRLGAKTGLIGMKTITSAASTMSLFGHTKRKAIASAKTARLHAELKGK